jgi:hypothetical protein
MGVLFCLDRLVGIVGGSTVTIALFCLFTPIRMIIFGQSVKVGTIESSELFALPQQTQIAQTAKLET